MVGCLITFCFVFVMQNKFAEFCAFQLNCCEVSNNETKTRINITQHRLRSDVIILVQIMNMFRFKRKKKKNQAATEESSYASDGDHHQQHQENENTTNRQPLPPHNNRLPVINVESKEEDEEEKEIITATITKSYREEKLGIAVIEKNNSLTVSSLQPDSPFRFTDLRVGMKVISVNGVDMKDEGLSFVMLLLRDSVGEVQIVAEGSKKIVAKIIKRKQEEDLGIQLKREDSGIFYVSDMSLTSPFANTNLAIGMKVKSINDIEITGEPWAFANLLLGDSVGELVIVAEPYRRTISNATATSVTTPEDEKLPTITPDQTIPSFVPSAPSGTNIINSGVPVPLPYQYEDMSRGQNPQHQETNQEILNGVNNQDHVRNGIGTESPRPTTIHISVNKSHRGEKLGVALKRGKEGGIFTVSGISPNSPFQNTALKVGMRVNCINGIEITGQEMHFILNLLQSTVGQVVFETLPQQQQQQQQVETTAISSKQEQHPQHVNGAPSSQQKFVKINGVMMINPELKAHKKKTNQRSQIAPSSASDQERKDIREKRAAARLSLAPSVEPGIAIPSSESVIQETERPPPQPAPVNPSHAAQRPYQTIESSDPYPTELRYQISDSTDPSPEAERPSHTRASTYPSLATGRQTSASTDRSDSTDFDEYTDAFDATVGRGIDDLVDRGDWYGVVAAATSTRSLGKNIAATQQFSSTPDDRSVNSFPPGHAAGSKSTIYESDYGKNHELSDNRRKRPTTNPMRSRSSPTTASQPMISKQTSTTTKATAGLSTTMILSNLAQNAPKRSTSSRNKRVDTDDDDESSTGQPLLPVRRSTTILDNHESDSEHGNDFDSADIASANRGDARSIDSWSDDESPPSRDLSGGGDHQNKEENQEERSRDHNSNESSNSNSNKRSCPLPGSLKNAEAVQGEDKKPAESVCDSMYTDGNEEADDEQPEERNEAPPSENPDIIPPEMETMPAPNIPENEDTEDQGEAPGFWIKTRGQSSSIVSTLTMPAELAQISTMGVSSPHVPALSSLYRMYGGDNTTRDAGLNQGHNPPPVSENESAGPCYAEDEGTRETPPHAAIHRGENDNGKCLLPNGNTRTKIKQPQEFISIATPIVVATPIEITGSRIIDEHANAIVLATVHKSSADQVLGVALSRKENGDFTVTQILPNGLFQATPLQEGMTVLNINGVIVRGKALSQVMNMLRSAVGDVVVAAINEEMWC